LKLWYILIIEKRIFTRSEKMVEEKINTLKKKLDELVITNAPYNEIYEISRQLDEYIALYYKEKGR
jgi:hypothetical protein